MLSLPLPPLLSFRCMQAAITAPALPGAPAPMPLPGGGIAPDPMEFIRMMPVGAAGAHMFAGGAGVGGYAVPPGRVRGSPASSAYGRGGAAGTSSPTPINGFGVAGPACAGAGGSGGAAHKRCAIHPFTSSHNTEDCTDYKMAGGDVEKAMAMVAAAQTARKAAAPAPAPVPSHAGKDMAITCHFCYQAGHKMADCRAAPPCPVCGLKGHLKERCRSHGGDAHEYSTKCTACLYRLAGHGPGGQRLPDLDPA